VETNYSHVLQADVGTPQPGVLLRNVHTIYHRQFGRWFGIMAPTSLLAGLVLVLADQRIKAINSIIPRGEVLFHKGDIAVMGAVRYGSFFFSWFLGCFALAAIATAVNDLDRGDEAESWERDSYQRAREHFGAIIASALMTFSAFLLGMFAMGFLELAAYRIVGWSHFSKYNYPVTVIGMVVVATFVSWLGASIPLILKGNTRVRATLRKSVELSNGYEGALFLLVVESVAGSMIVWYTVVHGLPLFLPRHLIYAAWYGWLLNAVGVLAASTIDAPLFIGLSLLADPERLNTSSLAASEPTA
jgi:hypothetical protein